jgi:FtsZ-binding cell division protein ZapB
MSPAATGPAVILQRVLVAKSAVAARAVDLEPIDRLEEKVKLLVGMIDRLRMDNARASEENARLTRELDAARARLSDAESAGSEMLVLREERDLIRARVDEMLQQIESLNL